MCSSAACRQRFRAASASKRGIDDIVTASQGECGHGARVAPTASGRGSGRSASCPADGLVPLASSSTAVSNPANNRGVCARDAVGRLRACAAPPSGCAKSHGEMQ